MPEGTPQLAGPCVAGGICCGKGKLTLQDGLWTNNPISIQILGICSALAVTNRLENSLVMGAALIFVCVGSNLLVSLLRNITPRRIRMIAEVTIIATFVIIFDQILKAYYWEMSKQLGPYVGLIITNCIIMGRAEAFALQTGIFTQKGCERVIRDAFDLAQTRSKLGDGAAVGRVTNRTKQYSISLFATFKTSPVPIIGSSN